MFAKNLKELPPAFKGSLASMDDSELVQHALNVGKCEFMGREFYVERGVLVPRAVTEVLLRACAILFEDSGSALTLVDVGCGAGVIGIMLAHGFPQARVLCVDISPDAVALTRRNIEMHGLSARVEVRQSDMFAALAELGGEVDAIVSSPPFISSEKLAQGSAHLLANEPRAAFDAGPYGIALHQRLVKESQTLLRAGRGWLVLEFGQGQDRQVRRLLERSGGYVDLHEFREASGSFVACLAARRGGESAA